MVPLKAGEAFEYAFGGGGGWGDPLERDPQQVCEDVLDEYVTPEGARRDYGVVLRGSLEALDLASICATRAPQAERRAQGRKAARASRRREVMKFGIALARLNPAFHVEATLEAERLGFESVWMAEHLVFPVEMAGSPHPGEDMPPVPPSTPVFDAFAYLSFLAGKTSRIRLGTNVYLLGLRHPFVAARAVQTLDRLSGGRAEIGIGAGWLRSEWTAAGLDPRTRGRRLDEALAVCKRLWSEEVVEHHGEFFDFGPVMFEPKPLQKPWPPLHCGGESPAALRRAALHCDGWYGLVHDVESAAARVKELRRLLREAGREGARFEVSLGGKLRDAGRRAPLGGRGRRSPRRVALAALARVHRRPAPHSRSRCCAG